MKRCVKPGVISFASVGLILLIAITLPEPVVAAPPDAGKESEEKEALQRLRQVYHERDSAIQASPSWCEACKALGKTRDPELVTSLERYMWREDTRVKSDQNLERYPALSALAEIGTPALPALARAMRGCKEERRAKLLALTLANLYGQQRFAESYLRSQIRQARESGQEEQAANLDRVLNVFRTAG
jgi:hypothetical protein